VAEGGGWGRNSATPERSAERSEANHFRFGFLDLCIIFGKMISKINFCFNFGSKTNPPKEVFRSLGGTAFEYTNGRKLVPFLN